MNSIYTGFKIRRIPQGQLSASKKELGRHILADSIWNDKLEDLNRSNIHACKHGLSVHN